MYEIFNLKNGIRVVCEHIPYVKSVSFGVWVGVGSNRETLSNNGISHFIEHMLFKGTKTRTAKQIAEQTDAIGGHMNAFTSRDCTCFYFRVISEYLEKGIDILSDMFTNSIFDSNDIALEKNVVLEEISMYEDSPEDIIQDIMMRKVWQGNSLGYPVLGTSSSLKKINREKIVDYIETNYTPENIVISVVGNFDIKNLLKLVEEKFGSVKASEKDVKAMPTPKFNTCNVVEEKDIEQTHLCISYEAFERDHELAYPLTVVNSVLGGGASSRLFQNIRENNGLAYSVYSYQSIFSSAGMLTVYAAMNPARLSQVQELIEKEIDSLVKYGITEDELKKTLAQLKSGVILGLESTSSRMNSYGQSLLSRNTIRTLDEIEEGLNKVNLENVHEAIKLVLKNPAVAIIKPY